jgi:hypothetical protein
MLLFSLKFLKQTLLALLIWIQLVCALPLSLSGTTLRLLFIVISRSVALQSVSVANVVCRNADNLTRLAFYLSILAFNYIYCYMLCFSLFFVFFILCLPVIGYLGVDMHGNE